jgi:hypothetical protein
MFIRLLFFLFFVNAGICLSQNCLDTILLREPYTNSNDIINGRRWKFEKKYKGSPLLTEDYWPEADILYNGIHFTGRLMNYDLYKNELIIFYPKKGKEKYLVLSNDKLSGFTFNDSLLNRTRIFEYIELPTTKGKSLYENASVGHVSFYIRPMKNIVIRSSGKSQAEFIFSYEYFLNNGKGFYSFHSKNQLIGLLEEHGPEMKKYIRERGLKINSQEPENIISVLRYFNNLK